MKAVALHRIALGLLVTLLLLPASGSYAAVDVYEFDTIEQEQRFRQLSNEFRCPMCQNANLTGSPGGVAADLRREIYYMIMDGKTDAEIEQFMLDRYGDFVLYNPRLTWQTVLLWFGPVLFFVIGVWVILGIIKRGRTERGQVEQSVSEQDRKRLQAMLDKADQESSDSERSKQDTPK